MIECRKMTCGHRGDPVLTDIDLKVERGELLVLAGLNGCGKSTLLKTLCGLLPPISGQVLLEGEPMPGLERRVLARQVALLPQSRDVPNLAVGALVAHGRFPHLGFVHRPTAVDREICEKAMVSAGAIHLRNRSLNTLSGGQRQRAYIAMVLAQDTPVILLDEPTTFLDLDAQFEILDLLTNIHGQGKTMVVALHDLVHGLSLADRIAVIHKGKVACCTSADEVYECGILEEVFRIQIEKHENSYFCCRRRQ